MKYKCLKCKYEYDPDSYNSCPNCGSALRSNIINFPGIANVFIPNDALTQENHKLIIIDDPIQKDECICEIDTLMRDGCVCGHIKEKYKPKYQ